MQAEHHWTGPAPLVRTDCSCSSGNDWQASRLPESRVHGWVQQSTGVGVGVAGRTENLGGKDADLRSRG